MNEFANRLISSNTSRIQKTIECHQVDTGTASDTLVILFILHYPRKLYFFGGAFVLGKGLHSKIIPHAILCIVDSKLAMMHFMVCYLVL
jgi:hypothetical protein